MERVFSMTKENFSIGLIIHEVHLAHFRFIAIV
jgi:hypothetical protein